MLEMQLLMLSLVILWLVVCTVIAYIEHVTNRRRRDRSYTEGLEKENRHLKCLLQFYDNVNEYERIDVKRNAPPSRSPNGAVKKV